MREFQSEEEGPYPLALVANALTAADPEGSATKAALDRLAEMAIVEGNRAYYGTWHSTQATVLRLGTFGGVVIDTGLHPAGS